WVESVTAAQHQPVQAVQYGVPGAGAGCERDRLTPGRFHGLDIVLELDRIQARDPDRRPHDAPGRGPSNAPPAHEPTLPRSARRRQKSVTPARRRTSAPRI